MSYRFEKETGDIVIDGWEQGIGPSPHKGIANIQNANISTELGEVNASFVRSNQIVQGAISGGTLTASGGDGTTKLAAPATLYGGQWINITATNITTNPTTYSASTLVIGGGGGGGKGDAAGHGAGGGGAGQYWEAAQTFAIAPYAVTVGTGGAGSIISNLQGVSGTSSSLIGGAGVVAVTATGGGGGGSDQAAQINGVNGGSGGGASQNGSGGAADSASHGHAGATGTGASFMGSGGGGAGAIGTASGGTANGGAGGAGTSSSINGGAVTRAGGGGGGASAAGTGGTATGGGGAGGTAGASGAAGTVNTGGGGGGGAAQTAAVGGAGGSGVVIIAYTTGDITATGGTITTSGGNTIHTFTASGTFTVTSINTSITLPTGNYYVPYKDSSNKVKISYFYDPLGDHAIVHGTSGTATFDIVTTFHSPVAKAVEKYADATKTQYRYYVLDASGYVWVYDTAVYDDSLADSGTGITWQLPDPTDYSATGYNSIAILNGTLLSFSNAKIDYKITVNLGAAYAAFQANLNNPFPSHNNFAYTGHQGRTYWCDGNYIGSIFPDTSLITGAANVQSYSKYTAVTTTGTVSTIISGSIPTIFDGGTTRIPAVFFTDKYGSQPNNLTAATIYYIVSTGATAFSVYAAASGGAAIDIAAGASGNQYFNTFYVGVNLYTITPQRVNLPTFEIAQSMVEIGNTILIGCAGNVVYPWNQIDTTPSSIITLPEGNVVSMLTVNQMAYIFAGNQGNCYITDGSTASLVINVPDYCAGVPGSPGTYIESTYTWGDSMYLRGRVYFSILDQTSTKAGNCGGVWSFVPTQNLYIGQDTGLALRLESQNSYNTYNGLCPLLIVSQVQNAQQPLYWSAWYSSVSAPTYGIDYSTGGTSASFPAVIETDGVPVGTMLDKKTYKQLEYKLGSPLDSGAKITAKYRVNLTDAWIACKFFTAEANKLSGVVSVNFEKLQWLQFQFTLTPITSSAATNTFIRFREIRLR